MTTDEIRQLHEAAAGAPMALLEVEVTGCAYSCCGRGWQRRDGYLQVYRGYVDNVQEPEGEAEGTMMVYSVGIGTISYVVALRWSEVADLRLVRTLDGETVPP